MDKIARPLDTSSINRVAGALALLAAILLLFPAPALPGLAAYPPLHTAMESLTVVVAMLVFATGINSHQRKTSLNLMLLSCAFLAVGLFDFGHNLSFPGMPDFVTPSGAEKAYHFWLAARLTAAVALLAAALLPWRQEVDNPVKAVCLALTLAFVAAVYWLILFQPDNLPRVFATETGLLPLERGFEYLIVGLHAATAVFFYRQSSTPRPYDTRLLFAAACVMGLGELIFAAHGNANDLLNLFGHLYKIIAYFLIYRAIFVYAIHRPHHELQKAEERLERVLEGSADGFWDCDLRSGVVEYSGRWAEMLGYRPDEIDPHSDSWKNRIHPDDRDRVLKAENDYVEGRAPAYDTEFRMQAKSGEWRHIRSRGKITGRDANGRALRISGAHTDVTAHRRAEEALQASEEKYRLIVESMTEGVWVTDNRGTTVFANQHMARMLGYTSEEMSGCHFHQFIDETQRAIAGYYWERRQKRISERHEFQFRRKDGNELWTIVSANPLTGEDGNLIGALAVVSDITERRRAEKKIARLVHRNALILDAAGKGICGMDKEGRVTFINRMAAKLLGYTTEEATGRSLHDLSHYRKADGSPYPAEECPIQAAARNGTSNYERDEMFWRRDGTPFPVEYTSTPILEGDMATGAVLVFSDISERKRIERQIVESHARLRELSAHLQTVREEEKARIAREIHDDLGGTLTALKIDVYWLARALPMEMTPFLERAESMSHLLDTAVDATRRIITELRPSILDDLGLLPTLEWQCAQFQKRTGIECRVECGENHNNLDKERAITLFRIFQEALTNVARHSGASRVEVTYSHDEQGARLCVRDDGCGLPADFAIDTASYGLRGMAERADSLGGQFSTANADTGGLAVEVRLPTRATEGGGGEEKHDEGKA